MLKKDLAVHHSGQNQLRGNGNTDGWRGYDGLVDVGFDRHYCVHHRHDKFVQGAAHINGIESFWSFAKSRLHQFTGVPKCTFLLHLRECEF